jgi:hypothetical protein
MQKAIISVVILLALTISFQAKAQYSILYEGEGFNVQFTYGDDGKALEIVMKSTVDDRWVKLQIAEFQPFDDGYKYVTKNVVGNSIEMEFHTNDELLTMTIVGLEDKLFLKKVKSYRFDNRKFK